MDLATIIGVIMGALLISLTAIMGGSLDMFVSVPGFFIVFGGVTAGVFIRYRMDEIFNAITLVRKCFSDERQDVTQIIRHLIDMANLTRKEGMLALERVHPENRFLRSAINHCVDGADPDFLAEILNKEIEYMTERHEKGIRMLEAIGDMAPAFGMLATLIGLVQALANINNPSAVGPAVAMALLGTLYGAALANLFMFPLAAKLGMYHDDEHKVRLVIRDGILGIQKGVAPRILKGVLQAALPPDKRGKV